MRYDLHVHSIFSDGSCSPQNLIKQAVGLGLAGIALTDHDTLDGLEAACQYINNHPIPLEFIPGIELNTEPVEGDNEVHILGYYIDHNHAEFKARLLEIREQRKLRAKKMVEKLDELGCKISYEKVISIAGSDLIARPHIAWAMVEAGYVENAQKAFDEYLDRGKPAYVSRYKFLPQEAIGLIKASGGIAVLAHPGLIHDQTLVQNLIDGGVDGLEVYYPQHSEQQIKAYLQLAQENKLLITGGSDYHGPDSNKSHAKLGAAGIDSGLMAKLKAFKHTKDKIY